ncbi:gtpase activating protein, putative [Ricinus communis]|uniref:Gtpase activating protein, putative n=1 Tax=Ricinus communis TaxID=3988 RepID=B9SVE5_RICCO|nr:gtpase activating protein, putative [Ricinus communis]
MTRLFRSKSCGLVGLGFSDFNPVPPPAPFSCQNDSVQENSDEEEEDEEEYDEEDEYNDDTGALRNPISTPFISPGSRFGGRGGRNGNNNSNNSNQFAIVDILVTALRKSIVTCSVEREDVCSMDISWPTDVKHVSHVTFDRFNGFLGLPTEFEPDLPRKSLAPVPCESVVFVISGSRNCAAYDVLCANVFGVSAKSMQCTYDDRGNSVPTILLMMQKRLYVEGGLKAEGIFRINAENSQEEYVRDQLNTGVVPRGIDVHCLAGLIKAWFRELPSGVLDSLTPQQVMHCNTEDDCTQLVKLLPSAEAALLDWAINLMADVVEHEQYNKMNARNIAMVFAPNMTQMADPLTALIHAVQVMNLLKTLILKNIREREESAAKARLLSAGPDAPGHKSKSCESNLNNESCGKSLAGCTPQIHTSGEFLRSATMNRLEATTEEKYLSIEKRNDGEEEFESISGGSPPSCETRALENGCKEGYDSGDWLSLRKGVRRLCRHPVFHLSKPANKKTVMGL